MILKTKRLNLEKAKLEDAPFFYKLLNSPNWIEFIGDRNINTLDDAEKYIKNSLIQSYANHGFGLYKMTLQSDGKPVGICGLLKRPNLDHPDIGFALLPEYAKQGYMFEAAEATMDYAKSILGIFTIVAITTERNTNSRKLLEKIGLKLKGNISFEEGGKDFLLYSNEN